MPNSIFSASNVGTVSVRGLVEAQQRLQRANLAIAEGSPGLRTQLLLAAGMIHRYLMGLSKDTPPVSQTGVLPVITGRLKNSFFWGVRSGFNSMVGFVATNLFYAPDVERRRGFLAKATKDMERPVNSMFNAWIQRETR